MRRMDWCVGERVRDKSRERTDCRKKDDATTEKFTLQSLGNNSLLRKRANGNALLSSAALFPIYSRRSGVPLRGAIAEWTC